MVNWAKMVSLGDFRFPVKQNFFQKVALFSQADNFYPKLAHLGIFKKIYWIKFKKFKKSQELAQTQKISETVSATKTQLRIYI